MRIICDKILILEIIEFLTGKKKKEDKKKLVPNAHLVFVILVRPREERRMMYRHVQYYFFLQ